LAFGRRNNARAFIHRPDIHLGNAACQDERIECGIRRVACQPNYPDLAQLVRMQEAEQGRKEQQRQELPDRDGFIAIISAQLP
jgi:hypothetical protein